MITCYIKYVIDPYQLDVFENYGKKMDSISASFWRKSSWLFLPHEGANNIAFAIV
jgi:hypothetical protein